MILLSLRAKGTAFCWREVGRSSVMGRGLLGCPVGHRPCHLLTCWGSISPSAKRLGGGPRPTFPKGGEKIPLCYRTPCSLGQAAASRHRGCCSLRHSHHQQQRVCGRTQRAHLTGIRSPFSFGDSAPNGYGGGVRKVPPAAAQHGSEAFISVQGKGIPPVRLGAASRWLPRRGGRWSPL